jgi:hypothetical protein
VLGEASGARVRVVPFPVRLARFLARLAERRAARHDPPTTPLLTTAAVRGAVRDIRYDTQRIRKVLGWRSETGPAEAMQPGEVTTRSTDGDR